ncbi:hypothetical protein PSEMO_62040 [Pseudomonas putida]|uniref:Uncharacterized protein n=1 Tax=Pseudomonas putida TaxID=303 RepID=A0A1Q9QUK7_PSEPU|nr:hypothetical protein PSEMO_62040 [Pseudomonas putida]
MDISTSRFTTEVSPVLSVTQELSCFEKDV